MASQKCSLVFQVPSSLHIIVIHSHVRLCLSVLPKGHYLRSSSCVGPFVAQLILEWVRLHPTPCHNKARLITRRMDGWMEVVNWMMMNRGIIRGEYRWLDWQGGQANSFPNDVLIYEWMPHHGRDGKEPWKEHHQIWTAEDNSNATRRIDFLDHSVNEFEWLHKRGSISIGMP